MSDEMEKSRTLQPTKSTMEDRQKRSRPVVGIVLGISLFCLGFGYVCIASLFSGVPSGCYVVEKDGRYFAVPRGVPLPEEQREHREIPKEPYQTLHELQALFAPLAGLGMLILFVSGVRLFRQQTLHRTRGEPDPHPDRETISHPIEQSNGAKEGPALGGELGVRNYPTYFYWLMPGVFYGVSVENLYNSYHGFHWTPAMAAIYAILLLMSVAAAFPVLFTRCRKVRSDSLPLPEESFTLGRFLGRRWLVRMFPPNAPRLCILCRKYKWFAYYFYLSLEAMFIMQIVWVILFCLFGLRAWS